MKREIATSCMLLANFCLLVYLAVLVHQRPSSYQIDERIQYWFDYYGKRADMQTQMQVRRALDAAAQVRPVSVPVGPAMADQQLLDESVDPAAAPPQDIPQSDSTDPNSGDPPKSEVSGEAPAAQENESAAEQPDSAPEPDAKSTDAADTKSPQDGTPMAEGSGQGDTH